MICLAKQSVERLAGIACGLAVMLAGSPPEARAQATFRVSADDIVSAVQVTYQGGDAGSSDTLPILNDRLSAGVSLLVQSPRLTLAGDSRAVVSFEPEVVVQDADEGSASQTRFGTRFMPAITLGVVGTPSERVSAGLIGQVALIADMTPGDGSFATSTAGAASSTGNPAVDAGTTPGESADTTTPVALGLPQNSWTANIGTVLKAGLTPTLKPSIAVQYRTFRYLDRYACTTALPLDGTLPVQNYENDALVLDSRWVSRVGERVGYAATVTARRDINRPYAACADTPAAGSADVYNQLNPAAAFFAGEDVWHLVVRPGVAVLWGKVGTAGASTQPVSIGLRVLPTGSVLGSKQFERWDVSVRAGLEAATLFGQAAPSYNAGADILSTWKPREHWTVRGGAGLLHTTPLAGPDEVPLPLSNAMTLWTGNTGVEWRPRLWVTLRMDYVFSFQALDLETSGTTGATGGTAPDRLRWHVLSLAASFVLGGGVGSDFVPRFEAGMER